MIKTIGTWVGAFLLIALGSMTMANAADKAASMTGTWNVTVQLAIGPGNPVFVVAQDGNKLTGTYKGALGESPISGAVDGNAFKVIFTASGVECEYAGTITGDEISGTVHLKGLGDGTFKGTRAK